MNLMSILKDYGITVSFFTNTDYSENNPSETIKMVAFKTSRGLKSYKLANECVSEDAAAWQALAMFIHDYVADVKFK